MKVCGVSFIRNAVKYDFPFKEAIQSILPLCDMVLIAHGDSDDDTDKLLKTFPEDKIHVINTVWDPNITIRGRVLADETNKALNAIDDEFDWLFYIQGDEVLHESGYEVIQNGMHQYLDDHRVEGFLFKYRHFYGSYDYIADSRRWYHKEIRIIRNDKSIRSYKDAQGFRKDGQKLKVRELDAYIHHYGWIKPPKIMKEKLLEQSKFRKDTDIFLQGSNTEFDYSSIDSLSLFKGTHPEVMQPRVAEKNWEIHLDIKRKKMSGKDRFHYYYEKITGRRLFAYRNYKKLR